MFVTGVLTFSIAAAAVSFLISKSAHFDRGKFAAFTVLVAWASLLIGLMLAKVSP